VPAGPDNRAPPATPRIAWAALVEYGIRLSLAGAICADLGFALDLDHKGWATAALPAGDASRPTAELTRLRAAGRFIAVTTGALARASSRSPAREPACWLRRS
jgi:hypothetical protein